MLVYNYDFSDTYDLLFEADTSRVITDITNILDVIQRKASV